MSWPEPKAYFKPSDSYEKTFVDWSYAEPDFKVLHLYMESESGRFLKLPIPLTTDQEQIIKQFYKEYLK
jgi:hypothetical protein